LGKTVTLAILACGLVLVVAMGSNRAIARVGGSGGATHWPNLAGDLFVVALAACLACAALIAYALWRGRRGRREPEAVRELPRVPWTDKALAVGMLAVVIGGVATALVVAVRRSIGAGLDQPPPSMPGAGTLVPLGNGAPSGASFTVHWWIVVGLVIIVAGGSVLSLARRRRPDIAKSEAHRSQRRVQVQAAVEETLEEITQEADPRRAIIRAYSRMEQTLAQNGLGRFPYEAPVEYLDRALATVQLSRSSAERLTNLFLRARFSQHIVDSGLKAEAIAALTEVRDELGAAEQ
jgi:hypothetical protein